MSEWTKGIEGYWSQYRRNRSSWWINLFEDLVEAGDLNTGDVLQKDCLWFCLAELLQEDLDAVKEHWNTHRIRKSRNDTTPGVPDVLYKALANEDTLLPTQLFPSLPARATFVAVSRTQNLCPQQMLPVQANWETFVSATMCPQQCVLVCQGLLHR